MNRLILLAVLLLLLAVVSSSSASRRDDPHKKHDESHTFVSRGKRNMQLDRAYRSQLFSKDLARKRRNKVDDHALMAEADSVAAAANAVAAGDSAVNAAIEIEQERQSRHPGQGGSENEHENDHAQESIKEEHGNGHGQGGSKDEHEESYGNDEETQMDTDEGDQANEVVEEETIHEKSKSSHKHTTSSEDDSQSEGLTSSDGEENSKTSVSKSNENGEALNKLMSQSSELAQQIRMVFDIMNKREKYLVTEMRKLQDSLADAIKVLKSDGTSEGSDGGTGSRKRRQSEEPYRACVYIESAVENIKNDHGHGHHRAKRNIHDQNPATQENMKVRPEVLVKHEGELSYPQPSENQGGGHQMNSQSDSSKREGIDLSKVYWIKLPEEQNMEMVHDKVQKVLTGISASDRDVLIIPVTKAFTSKQQVTNEFFNVFRNRRSITKQKRVFSNNLII